MPAMQETRVWPLGQEDPLEKPTASRSSILVRRIPWTEEPVGLVCGIAKSWAWLRDWHTQYLVDWGRGGCIILSLDFLKENLQGYHNLPSTQLPFPELENISLCTLQFPNLITHEIVGIVYPKWPFSRF